MFLALALIAVQSPAQHFPVIDRPGADPRIGATLHALCPSPSATDPGALTILEGHQAEAALASNSADSWRALACTRALLSTFGKVGALSHDGPLMIAGDSWAQGAAMTALRVLSLRPADRIAGDILGFYALNESDPHAMEEIAGALAGAVSAGARSDVVLRSCAELNLRFDRIEMVRSCASKALAAGHDSTEYLLILTRLGFRECDTINGVGTFVHAAAAARDTVARLAIGWHLQWFLSPDEQKQWPTLPDSARGAWMRDRLASRDVRDGQPPGSRLAEHFARLEHVDKYFRLRVPRVRKDVQRTEHNSEADPQAIPIREYVRWQVDFDDRGVVWMRFGKPAKISTYVDDTLTPYEAWEYEIDGESMVLNFVGEDFSGSSSATTLRAGIVGRYLCNVDSWRCTIALKSNSNNPGPPAALADLRNVVARDREDIGTATTKDDNSPRGDKPIEVISRLHRLWDSESGNSFALVTYAVKGSDLSTQPSGSQKTALVDFDFRRWSAVSERMQDTTFTRRLILPDSNSKKLHVTGFFTTQSSPDVSSWSMVATQPDNRRGRAWDVTTAPLDHGPVALSDLVLGQEGQGVVWNNHNVEVPLAPLNAVDRKKPVSLYYQVRSAEAHAALKTTVALYRLDGGVSPDSAAFLVTFDQALRAGVNEIAPSLDLAHLEHGSYRLEVRLMDARGVLATRRTVQLNLD